MIKQLSISIVTAILAVALFAQFKTGATISGSIKNTNGAAIAKAKVELSKKGSKPITTEYTDSNGNYSFSNLEIGDYTLSVSAIGYISQSNINVKVSKVNNSLSDVLLQFIKTNNDLTKNKTNVKKTCCDKVFEGEEERKSTRAQRYEYQNAPVMSMQEDFNTEEYDKINDNEFKLASANPLSTFSIDVDKASYSNARRYINSGTLPPKDAVRVEEMINYFKYEYPQPKNNTPFSINMEMNDCPWNSAHKLVQVGLQGKTIENGNLPAANLVFLIDVSGSMASENKLPLLKKSFTLLVEQLREQDKVSIVVYAGAAGLVLPSTPGNEKRKILDALDNLNAGGSTAGGQGIVLAYKVAKENFMKNGNNRVILASDGDFNVGVSSNGELVNLIEEKRKEGTYLTVLGFGMGNYKDSKMEQLADKGNGNYAYIDNILEAKKVFVNELGGTLATIAKDVKVQIEFNPTKVKAYRLVGYENRLLAKEDFNDDTKDAGELGAGHTVTALYEIIPASSTENINGVDPLKYQTTTKMIENATSEVMTIKFRYKNPSEEESKLITEVLQDTQIKYKAISENFKFAAAVAEFGMLLRDSKFKGTSTYKSGIALAKEAKGKDDDGYRAEMIKLMEMAELMSKNTQTGSVIDIEE